MAGLSTTGIAVVSTIRYTDTDLEDNFRKGVKNVAGNQTWCDAAVPLDNLGFDFSASGPLQTAIQALNANTDVGLIITAGGLASAIAALQRATTPFLSIVGGATADFDGKVTTYFKGGVNLDTFHNNQLRVDHLHNDLSIPLNKIALLSNPKAAMSTAEKYEWKDTSHATRGNIYDAYDLLGITKAFKDLVTDMQDAIIISADAFFQDNKAAIIEGAKASGKRACYPFHVFDNDSGTHKPRKPYTKHGPRLSTEYFTLGKMAANLVKNGTVPTLVQAVTYKDLKDENQTAMHLRK